jgi:hypothetical protein
MKRRNVLAAGLLVLLARGAHGDSPKAAPATYRVQSLNHLYSAELNHETGRTIVFEARSGRKLWEIPGWYRVAALSNDGMHLVIGYDGSNLLNTGSTLDEVMLTFYRQGKKTGVVKLRELVPELSRLRKTASHLYWGEYLGFDERDRYRVKTVDGKVFLFDPGTAKIVGRRSTLINRTAVDTPTRPSSPTLRRFCRSQTGRCECP